MARSSDKGEGNRRRPPREAVKEGAREQTPPRGRAPEGAEKTERSERKRGRLEGMVPDIVRKAMVSGLGAIFMTEETIRTTLSDMPKDAVNFLVNQADQTKEQLLTLIAREVREFLESADLSDELAKVLARLTLDIRTQIRFVPTEGSDELTLRPDLEYDVQVSRKPKKK